MSKFLIVLVMVAVVASCQENIEIQPSLKNERAQMLEVLEFTAKTVSEIAVSRDVREEVLSYGLPQFDGEVTAHFSKLLSDEVKLSSRGTQKDAFSNLFRAKVGEFRTETENDNRYNSAEDPISYIEKYLKLNNMALYGPYLAENHADSDKPITVSFDPLDDSKYSNVGYMFVPKQGEQSSANMLPNVPYAIEDYHMVEVQNVDDQYAYDNPTVFVIIDDEDAPPPGGSNGGGGTGGGGSEGREIDCNDLDDTDIVSVTMREFRLMGNLRSAPWNRNLLDLWAISGDDINFDQNNTAILNNSTAKLWHRKQVSKSDGRNERWLSSGLSFLDTNWKEEEVDLYLVISYKSGNDGGTYNANVRTVINKDADGNSTNETTTTLDVSVPLAEKFEVFHGLGYDRCATLAGFTSDNGFGLRDGLGVVGADKMQFTFKVTLK
ncbi:hypothetical protein [Roseivirga pacifica]|uniref:hypothetical protein n=1 Tax=Roseivirga pacifica TaxID=1267423 RepID=UPI002095C03E|nr:hypothetical protein [Roseivirga pacifica]MCO6357718.1 hypothetical protein [Roseivirga pacifica]MCO6365971.1 hypothetical protein [Roseivirga pacifica]MCO6371299.1 hypothetical protein [Roseivirga pacifica]MCO6375530.1 hypothetical protein [Roseivirga pacifica]MCO6378677.1 hypothetical protein [Roseivirga pacifica]